MLKRYSALDYNYSIGKHAFNNSINISALNLYMKHLYVPSPYSIFNNIFKLEPGCIIRINKKCLNYTPNITLKAPYISDGINLKKWKFENNMVKSR